MKIYKLIFTTLILFLLPAYSYSATFGSLHISLTEGNVQLKPEDTSLWVPASINMPVLAGDELWVPESGTVELQLSDGTFVRLNKNSSLQILTIEEGSFQFYLTTGHAYVNFRGRDSILQMDTPVSSVRAYDRSKFRIDVSDNSKTEISVFKGAVYAESRNGKTRVSAGNTLSIGEDFFADLSPLGPPDEWERWNRERDRKLVEGRYSQRYLPDELNAYAYDFDENGKWVYASDYGYVWTPTVIVSAGWAPYRIGRWAWIGSDYVWVSYEPWGWVPYHYGRWTYIVSIGWAWVPPVRGAVYWGPGFVGWVYTPTYVSWVPLAPGDIYYGYGYYGPSSVNIINIDIHKTVIKNVYKNVHVNNAVTVVHHDTFVRGKHVDVKIKENPFLRERLSIGRPQIKPEKSAFMPIIKEIPKSDQPPQKIRDIKIRELKRERPLIKEKKASVLRPESPQKTMPIRTLKEPRSLKTRPSMERETVPERQIQPSGKQKPEGRIIERQRKTGEPSFERQPSEKKSIPQQIQPREKKSVPQQIQPREKKSVPQQIQPREKKSVPQQIQPRGKEKSEGKIIERQMKTMEPVLEKQPERSVKPLEKQRREPAKGYKQSQPLRRQQQLEDITTEKEEKIKEPSMEKQKRKARSKGRYMQEIE